MKGQSDDPFHHERTLLPRSYISLPPIHLDQMLGHRLGYDYLHFKNYLDYLCKLRLK